MKFPLLKNKFVLAPMAEVTTLPFRLLCREYGASIAWTEQVNALALSYKNPKTMKLTQTCKEDKPLVLQLSGNDADLIIKSAKIAKNYDVLDINMGCPSRKIVKLGYGSALLKEKNKLKQMMTKIVNAIDKPVTVKMRSGFKKNEAVEIAQTLEKAGVAAITIHARTQEQKYKGTADWSIIKNIKDKLNIPVIGNGDVTTPEKAYEMLEKTGCDYVMIGRAAIKNPFIFKQCIDFAKGKYNKQNKIEMFRKYVDLCQKYKFVSLSNLKMIAGSFLHGESDSAKIRDKISKAKTEKEVISIFNTFLNQS